MNPLTSYVDFSRQLGLGLIGLFSYLLTQPYGIAVIAAGSIALLVFIFWGLSVTTPDTNPSRGNSSRSSRDWPT